MSIKRMFEAKSKKDQTYIKPQEFTHNQFISNTPISRKLEKSLDVDLQPGDFANQPMPATCLRVSHFEAAHFDKGAMKVKCC